MLAAAEQVGGDERLAGAVLAEELEVDLVVRRVVVNAGLVDGVEGGNNTAEVAVRQLDLHADHSVLELII